MLLFKNVRSMKTVYGNSQSRRITERSKSIFRSAKSDWSKKRKRKNLKNEFEYSIGLKFIGLKPADSKNTSVNKIFPICRPKTFYLKICNIKIQGNIIFTQYFILILIKSSRKYISNIVLGYPVIQVPVSKNKFTLV